VHTIDGRTIGDGSQGAMTARLRELYLEAMSAEVASGGFEATLSSKVIVGSEATP